MSLVAPAIAIAAGITMAVMIDELKVPMRDLGLCEPGLQPELARRT